jgi:3-deoxy-D-manno-octulosonic-acid transferase
VERGKGRLWFHVASVGEFNTAKPLLKRLYRDYHITLTYFSFRARKYLESQKGKGYFHELYRLPPDIPFLISKFERKIDPEAILIMERELWPFLILSTRAPKVWLNAYSKGGVLERWFSKRFSLILAREERSSEKFRSYGSAHVHSCGNLKFVLEEPPPSELEVKGSKLLVAGSTHSGEELIIKRAYERLLRDFESLKLLIAPRHVSRAGEVMKLFDGMGVCLRSREEKGWKVLVVDTLGELFSLYRYANVAFVGGTFVPVGGHNLLEPAYFGKPVLYGPNTKKVEDLRAFLEERGLGFCVKDEEELYRRLLELLSREENTDKTGLREHSEKVLECYLSSLNTFLKKVL